MTAVGTGHWAASRAAYLELGSTATATGGGKATMQVLKGVQLHYLGKLFLLSWTVGRKVGPPSKNLSHVLACNGQ